MSARRFQLPRRNRRADMRHYERRSASPANHPDKGEPGHSRDRLSAGIALPAQLTALVSQLDMGALRIEILDLLSGDRQAADIADIVEPMELDSPVGLGHRIGRLDR